MKKGIVFIILFSVFFTNTLVSRNINKITLSEDPWPPYTLGEVSKEPTGGIAVEFANEIFGRLQIETEIKLYPWKRCLNQMETGQRDGLLLLTKNKEREEYMVYSDKIMSDRDLIWYKKGKNIQWDDLEDLKEYRIGKTAGFNYGDKFNEAAKKYSFTIHTASGDWNNFKKLDANRIDIFICNETAAKSIFKEDPELAGKFEYANKPLKSVDFHMSFSKKSEAVKILDDVNRVINELKEDGTIDRILTN